MCRHPKTVFRIAGLCVLVGLLWSASAVSAPPPTAVSEPIEEIPATDWQAIEPRLRRLISETVQPKRSANKSFSPDVEALLAWSKPVNGLAARIERVWASSVFFIRLKNVSEQPISVPTGNPSNEKSPRWFEAYIQQGAQPWRQFTQTGPFDRYLSEAEPPRTAEDFNRPPSDRPWVTLKPGEDCLALGTLAWEEGSGEPKTIKVVLRQPDASLAGRWSGVVETPPQPLEWSAKQYRSVRGALPFPSHFPAFSYDYRGFINGLGDSTVELLHGPNRFWIEQLKLYDPASVAKEFERRMQAEKTSVPMKFLLACPAAAAGSEEAAIFFLESAKDTNYFTARNLHYALSIANWHYTGERPDWQRTVPPGWLVELSVAILADSRVLTGMEKIDYLRGKAIKVSAASRNTDNLMMLAKSSDKLLPLLIGRVKAREADWGTLQTLASMGDLRAAPVLIEGVKGGWFDADLYESAVYALSRIKAKEAVPALLADIEQPIAIEALGEIGDPRALPALREVAAAKGSIIRGGEPVSGELDRQRYFRAKMALSQLDRKDAAVTLAEMLADPTWQRDERYEIVSRMVWLNDPRVIPHLIKVIQTESQRRNTAEPNYYIIEMAVGALGELKYRAAVEGLIECLGLDFNAEYLGKGEHATPVTYRNRIAKSLQALTGQSFGGDKQPWLKWWREAGQRSSDLK